MTTVCSLTKQQMKNVQNTTIYKAMLKVVVCACLHAGLKTYLISGKKMGSQCGCSQNSLGRDYTETPRPSPHTHTSELSHTAMADHTKVGLNQMHAKSHTPVSTLIHTHTHLHVTCINSHFRPLILYFSYDLSI